MLNAIKTWFGLTKSCGIRIRVNNNVILTYYTEVAKKRGLTAKKMLQKLFQIS